MVKAFEGYRMKPGSAGGRGLISQGAQPRGPNLGICPPSLLAVTAIRG